jgi:MFS transporter, FSR family, fosmidomycin resistance protein
MPARRRARTGLAAAAMVVVFVDELVDGTRGAALPLIRHDLGLSYAQVGLLFSVPLLLGSVIELPMGLLAGYGDRRRRAALAGGVAVVGSMVLAASARGFPVLLAAMVAFFPAAGAFVSLTEADLMDANPARREQYMAAWTLAGSLGAVGGPGVLLAALVIGGGWRGAFVVLAAAASLAWVLLLRWGAPATPSPTGSARRSSRRDLVDALRARQVVRWLILLQVADLLLDVLTGFVALYFVDVVHTAPSWGVAAIAVRLAAGVVSEAALVPVLGRVDSRRVVVAGAMLAVVAYPAFLVAPGPGLKIVVLGVLSAATAPWYPVLQAQLYRALDDHSAVAVTLSSAASLAGGVAPLVVGLAAERFGLGAALAGLVVVAPVVLAGVRPRSGARRRAPSSGRGRCG